MLLLSAGVVLMILVWFAQFDLFDFGIMGIVSVGYDGVWPCLWV